MNFKRLIFALVATAMLTGVASAAQPQSKTDKSVEFRPHWSLQLQGGAAATLGETTFSDLISPAAFLSAGYKFMPELGVRVGFGGWQGKGYLPAAGEGYAFNFLQGHADLMLDFSSLVGGFNHRRVATVFMFAGVGVTGCFDNDEAVALYEAGNKADLPYLWENPRAFAMGRLGLGVDFRVCKNLTLNIEANAEYLSDHFNSKKAENLDWQFNLLAGLTVNFGKNHRPSAVYAAEQAAAAELAAQEAARRAAEEAAAKAAAEQAAAEAAAKAAAEQAELDAAEKAKAMRAAVIAENTQNIFFTIGSSVIREEEAQKIEKLAAFLVANPDYRAIVVGYADKETGNSDINTRLSKDRAEKVSAVLAEAGVPMERISTAFKGDKVQPYGQENDKNRVVICTID